jgi:hypothetical protein
VLEPDFSAADRPADCAEDPQDDADQNEQTTDGVQDRDAGEVADQEKDDAKNNHDQSDPYWVIDLLSQIGITGPVSFKPFFERAALNPRTDASVKTFV